MSKSYEDHMYNSFRDVAYMLLHLIIMIEQEDLLKKNHKAYLPVRRQITETCNQYRKELRRIMNDMKKHEAEEAKARQKRDLIALHGDFFLARYDFLMMIYAQIDSLYHSIQIYREQQAEKAGKEIYDPLEDNEHIVFEIKDWWDHSIVTEWFNEERNVQNE